MDLGGGAEVGEAIGDGFREAEDFGHLAKGRAWFIGDDIGGHGGTAGSVFLKDVLDDGFAALAGREVDIDVRPRLSILGEEALEEESTLNWIDTCYANCVTDKRVGGGAPALAEDALGAGETDDVPNDEEIA